MKSKEIKKALNKHYDFANAYGEAIEELERLEKIVKKFRKMTEE